jgi:hypothetical protein
MVDKWEYAPYPSPPYPFRVTHSITPPQHPHTSAGRSKLSLSSTRGMSRVRGSVGIARGLGARGRECPYSIVSIFSSYFSKKKKKEGKREDERRQRCRMGRGGRGENKSAEEEGWG